MSLSAVLDWLNANRDDLPTPLYLYDLSELDRAVELLAGLLPQRARLFYSVKANPQPALLQHFKGRGVGAEVVSDGELAASTRADVAPQDTILGGVAKSTAQLLRATSQKFAALVIDSEGEWARLCQGMPKSGSVELLLRVNPGDALGDTSQFGLSPSQAMALARRCAETPGLGFLGLHLYLGPQRLTCAPIVETVDWIAGVVETFKAEGLPPKVVNVGLGCGVPYLEKDAELPYDDLRGQLQDAWARPAWQEVDLWSEAGRYLVARSGYFIARVAERKELNGKRFLFLDGGLNAHNPGVGLGRLFRSNPRFLFVTSAAGDRTETIDIVGNLCTAADCLGRDVEAPALNLGDLVVIPNAGAYCQTTALWGFNSQTEFREWSFLPDGTAHTIEPQQSFLSASAGV